MTFRKIHLSMASVALLAAVARVAGAGVVPASQALVHDPSTGDTVIKRWDGATIRVGKTGLGSISDATGRKSAPLVTLPAPHGAAGLAQGTPNEWALARHVLLPDRGLYAKHQVLMVLESATVTGAALAHHDRAPRTSDAVINAALAAVGARSMRSVAPLTGAAALSRGGGSLDVSRAVLVDVGGLDARESARRLAATPGVAYAAPNWTVSSFASDPVRIPSALLAHAPRATAPLTTTSASAALPNNYAVSTSESSFLNASGVNALSAYARIAETFHEFPGHGIIVTNVCLGDLTDQQMADNGDFYVQYFGPTTRVIGGQRYLDYPSLPLIPTFVARNDGSLDPLGAVEQVDPYLGEVLLDFSVMAPLPHGAQRSGALGSGYGDLLGIAPGATYRLVVPEQPTIAQILIAALAAAEQQPRPDVMNLSLGFGFDSAGFPGRFLEDDPLARAVMQSIVEQGIVVTVSANDGLRAYTNAAIGPDGGSAPTQRPRAGQSATIVFDVAYSTAPSVTPDSGSFAVGGSTLDDIFSVPPQNGGALSHQGAFPTTRLNGAQGFSSGFGTRLDVSAPSDNIPALLHVCLATPCTPQDSVVSLDGGTSASAPMTAAAAAVVLQVARHMGQTLNPHDVRRILSETARPLPQAPQSDRSIGVGPQIDVGAAVNSLMGNRTAAEGPAAPVAVRLAVAHRQWADINLGADFVEATDRSNIDLAGPYDPFDSTISYGQNATGPVTLSADIVGDTSGPEFGFQWSIGGEQIKSAGHSIRLTPEEILAMAHLPLASESPRTVPVSFSITRGNATISSISTKLTFGPTDGRYTWPLAPVVPAVAAVGASVPVKFDLTNLRHVSNPVLVVSSVDHWNVLSAPKFRPAWSTPLPNRRGEVVIPAAAFTGAGVYGIAIVADDSTGDYGQFAALRIAANSGSGARAGQAMSEAALSALRPAAPTLGTGGGSAAAHSIVITNAAPKFAVHYDVSAVAGADGAYLEISAPGPTIYGLYSTFTNQNGDERDANGLDSGSTVWRHLKGQSGTLDFDATSLGLHPSLIYSVRVLPAQGGAVLGEASAVSSVEFDDGPLPAGIVGSFAIDPAASFASIDAYAGPGLGSSSVLHYDPTKGTYEGAVAADFTGVHDFTVLGVDPSEALLATISDNLFDYSQSVTAFDTINGTTVSNVNFAPVAGSWNIVAAQVDDVRHRLAMMAWNPTDYSDNVLSFDLPTGDLGKPIKAGGNANSFEFFNTITLDKATGIAFPVRIMLGDICVVMPGGIGRIDFDQGLASPIARLPGCVTSAAPDERGGRMFVTLGPLYSYPSLLPPARLLHVKESSLASGPISDLGPRSPLFSTIDPVHRLLVTGFVASDNYLTDNNAMSAIGVFSQASGARVAYLPYFNFVSFAVGPVSYNWLYTKNGIQLDPKTRTGWTFGPGQSQIQQFKY